MKLVVLAHTPPPLHGQSYMVQLLLDGLRSGARDPHEPVRFDVYHVNACYSTDFQDIGRLRWRKPVLLLWYCLQTVWYRLRHGATCLYYVPASTHKLAIYRDWLVMLLCRPFFRKTIFHWEAVGLGEWVTNRATSWERWLTRHLLGRASLSIVLSPYYVAEARMLDSKRVEVVPNGIPDPCPDSSLEVMARRRARLAARAKLLDGVPLTPGDHALTGDDPQIFRVLCLSLLTRDKGTFDAMDAVALVNRRLAARGAAVRVRLDVGGKFFREADEREFRLRLARPEFHLHGSAFEGTPAVRHLGFVESGAKARLLAESDCFCFPTYWMAEAQPVALIEAMAFDLPIITTRWRGVPELLPPNYEGLVEPRSPIMIAAILERFLTASHTGRFRETYLAHYTDRQYVERIERAIATVMQ